MSLLCRPNKSLFRLQFHSCEHRTAIVFWTELEYLTAFSFKSSLTKFLFYFSAGKDVFVGVKVTEHFQYKIRLTFGPGTPGSPRSPFPTGPVSPLSPYCNRYTFITKYWPFFSTPPTQHDQRNQIIRRKYFQVYL